MSSFWGAPIHCDFLLIAQVSRGSKLIIAIGFLLFLFFIIYLMLRSLGIDRNTPPSMVFKKSWVFLKSFYVPFMFAQKMPKAEEAHEAGRLAEALELYMALFYFDGLTSTNPEITIHNETILDRIEEICAQTSFEFPGDRINRFREDLFDYFLVKQKHLAPVDYDGTPLHRPENEERFKDKLNLSQERALIEGFEQFLTTLAGKIEKHLKSGVQILPRGAKSATLSGDYTATGSSDQISTPFAEHQPAPPPPPVDPFRAHVNPFGDAVVDPNMELAPPDDLFGASESFAAPARNSTSPPGLFGAPPAHVAAQAPAFAHAEPNPFSIDDPHDPFRDSTGVMHKLPGAEADHTQPPDPFSQFLDKKSPRQEPPPPPRPAMVQSPGGFQAPQPTGGFPGLGGGLGNPGIATPPSSRGAVFPQPTSGFPGFAAAPTGMPAPQAAAARPGLAVAPGPMAPQPTSGFPGLAPAPTAFPPINAAAGFPQPTGGFPGFQSSSPPPPPGNAGFPQHTGGFPGFAPNPQTPPLNTGFPQPTGGFPGFQPPPPNSGGFPPNPFHRPEEKKGR